MIRSKGIVGLLLLSALAFCAFGAASASAAGTTAGECVIGGTKDFEDAHCDKAKTGGEFGHSLFANNVKQKVTATNNKTGSETSQAVLEGVLGGVALKTKCNTVSGSGEVENEVVEGVMRVTFPGISETKFTNCDVFVKATEEANVCDVAEPIVVKATETDPMTLGLGEERTGPTSEKVKVIQEGKGTEMGLKFSPSVAGGNFTELEFVQGTKGGCPAAILGKKAVKGYAYAIGGRGGSASSSGATAVFTKASTLGKLVGTVSEGLTLGGQPAYFETTLTFKGPGGNPLIITTTTT